MTIDMNQILARLGPPPLDATERLFDEVRHLPVIADSVRGLVALSCSLAAGSYLIREGRRCVLYPLNFVAFTPHHDRGAHVTVDVRGRVVEFERSDVLPLMPGRGGAYASFKFSTPRQLAAAANCIERAHELYRAGRRRFRTVHRASSGAPIEVVAGGCGRGL
jgi:hypothetical protein